jgi:class 3 adenylate cyclase
VPIQPLERKLAAIFAADIAGYSRLMAGDEVGTLARLKACRVVIDGLIETHRGRIFNTARDSVVADFASAVDVDGTRPVAGRISRSMETEDYAPTDRTGIF